MKNFSKQLIGFLISAILIYSLVFHLHIGAWVSGEMGFRDAFFGETRFNLEDLKKAGTMIQPGVAFLAVFLLTASLFVRGWRWQLIIKPVGKAGYWLVFWSSNVGYLLNNVLPFRAGEFIRGVLVAKRSDLSVGSVVATVLVERLFDLVGLGLVFAITLLFYPLPEWIRYSGGILFSILVGCLVAGWILAKSYEKVQSWTKLKVKNRGKVIRKTSDTFLSVIRGMKALSDGGVFIGTFLSTVILWAMYLSIMKIALDAFSLTDGSFPLLDGLCFLEGAVITIVTSIGMGIPSAPGAVGTYHGAVVLALAMFEVPESIAVLFAAAIHAMNYITLTVMGLIGLWALKISWSWIRNMSKEQQNINSEKT